MRQASVGSARLPQKAVPILFSDGFPWRPHHTSAVTKAHSSTRTIAVDNLPIELSKLLKLAGFADSGGNAKHAIHEGLVLVNGSVETRKGKKLAAGDRVTFNGESVVIQPE